LIIYDLNSLATNLDELLLGSSCAARLLQHSAVQHWHCWRIGAFVVQPAIVHCQHWREALAAASLAYCLLTALDDRALAAVPAPPPTQDQRA
jgi:hypothetical protein